MWTADERERIHQIYVAVCGDESLGHLGLVKRVKKAEDAIEKIHLKVAWVSGAIMATGTIINLALKFFWK